MKEKIIITFDRDDNVYWVDSNGVSDKIFDDTKTYEDLIKTLFVKLDVRDVEIIEL